MLSKINKEEILGLMDKSQPMVLVEALPIKYFNEAHLPGAVQIDYTEVTEKAPSLLTNKSNKIVVYCASSDCENSTKAATTLDKLGYENVFIYKEGKKEWIDSGLPIETDN